MSNEVHKKSSYNNANQNLNVSNSLVNQTNTIDKFEKFSNIKNNEQIGLISPNNIGVTSENSNVNI